MRSVGPWVALLLAAPIGAGCPIPQAVPEYPKGAAVPAPRIVAELVVPQGALIRVPVGCTVPPTIDLSATLRDEDIEEPVEARWFVDYDVLAPDLEGLPVPIPPVPQPNPNAPITTREIPAFVFSPYAFGGGLGAVHVVELVVSNGFPPAAAEPYDPFPYRTPLPGFETQVYRWLFILVDDPGACPTP